MRGFIAVPLAVRRHCTGILWQIRTTSQPQLSEDDQRFLEEVGAKLACGIAGWT